MRLRIRTLMIAVAMLGTGFAIPTYAYVDGVLSILAVGLVFLIGIGLTALVVSPFLWGLLWAVDRCLSAYRFRDR